MSNSVCFSGHRSKKYNFSAENKQLIYERLTLEICSCIKYGYDTFYFGGCEGFDLMAAFTIIYLKRIFKIKLICALPYENFYLSDEFDNISRNDYLKIINKCDEIINITGEQEKTLNCYARRNMFLIDKSSLLICLYDGKSGGTLNTINYAK